MADNRLPKKMFIWEGPHNKGPRGRPRIRWKDEVYKDARRLDKDWKEVIRDRDGWRRLLRMARNRRILRLPNERMNECNVNISTPSHSKAASGAETAQSEQCLQYGLKNQGVVVRVLAGSKELYLVPSVKTHSGVNPASYSMGTVSSSPGKITKP